MTRWPESEDRPPTPQAVLDAWLDWYHGRCSFAAYLSGPRPRWPSPKPPDEPGDV